MCYTLYLRAKNVNLSRHRKFSAPCFTENWRDVTLIKCKGLHRLLSSPKPILSSAYCLEAMRGTHSFAPQTLLSFQTYHLNPSNKTFNWQSLWFSQCPTIPSPSVLQRTKQQASPTLLLRDSNWVHNLHWAPIDFHHMSARHSKTPIIPYTEPYIFTPCGSKTQ